jgi:hypothetical protein
LQNQLASASSGDNLSRTNGYTIANNTALDESTSYVNAYGVNPATNSFRAGGNNISVADLADEQSIADAAAYRLASTQVELAPMVGYRIVNKLNIAAGADVAHIFQSTPYTDGAKRLLLQSQQNPTLKAWDMGLIGKVEYKVSKRIVVGYRRREGLTNMTTGANANTKRSYNGILVRLKIK